jgi:hypothetical protein
VSYSEEIMTIHKSEDIARRAEAIYESRLKDELERSHGDAFVAIEPDSGEYFLGRTLSEAIGSARRAHPDRLAHALRVGHKAGVQLFLGLAQLQ